MDYIFNTRTLPIALLFAITFSLSNQNAYSQTGELQWGSANTQCTTNTITGAAGLGVQPVCTGNPGTGNATLLNGVNATVTLAILPTPGINPAAAAPVANAVCSVSPSLLQNCPGNGAPGVGTNFEDMSMNATTDDCTAVETVTVVFDPPVTNPSFTLHDIDSGSSAVPPANWQDLVIVTAVNIASANVSASSVVLGGANVAQVTDGTDFGGSPCSGGTPFPCPANTTCFRGLDSTDSSSADSNATLSYTGNIISISVSYTAGNVSGTNPSDQFVTFGPITWSDTLPVTLASFSSSNTGGGLRVDWSTSTETINIGFNIYAYIGGEKVIINYKLIPSHAPNSLEPQFYEEIVDLPEGVTQLGISAVDIRGHEDYFGPYEIGESYGSEPVSKKIDWKKIKEKYNQKMAGEGFEMRAGRMRATARESGLVSGFIAKAGAGDSPVCNVSVSKEGMYRVRQRDLRNAGCDFRGEDIEDIAVTYKGEPVSRRIISNTGKVKNGTNIFFYAETPKGKDYLYTTENVYQVSIDSSSVDNHEDVSSPGNKELGGFETSYMHTVYVEKNIAYDFTTPYGKDGDFDEVDPWYEENIFASPGSPSLPYTYEIPVLDDVDTTRDGKLKMRLIGVTDFPEETIDHQVMLKLNGSDAGTYSGEGRLNWFIEVPVGGSDLTAGVNQLEVVVTGNLPVFDFMHTDSYGLMYWRPAAAIEDLLNFKQAGSDEAGYSISGYSVKNVQAYGEKDGQLYKLRTKKVNEGGKYTVSIKSLGEGARYWVSPVSEFNEGDITKAEERDINFGSADVLIITHPALMGSDVDAYAGYVTNQGYTVKVVNVLNVYDGYGYGMPTPGGIRNYLEYAKNNLGVQYAAIIGGTTTEYPDPETIESIQYVPTEFEFTQELIFFTPCDGCMADFNADDVPDLKIFRIPSRQTSDTAAVVSKSNSYTPDASALLLAEHTQEQNFGAQLDAVSSALGGYDIMKVYLSDIAAENGGLSVNDAVCVAQLGSDCPACTAGMPCETMTGFIEQINDGKRLIMFNGHGSVPNWTFNGLFTSTLAEGLTNAVPNVVIPMACYTTYYQNPGSASLADQLLFNAGGGSAAVSGAATLSSLSDNGTFAESILTKMCDGTTNLAEAVYQTKQENPGLRDQVINWDLIGNGFVTIAGCEDTVVEPSSGEETPEDQ